jgi:hypothetical protein
MLRNTSRIANFRSEIWFRDVMNMKQGCQPLSCTKPSSVDKFRGSFKLPSNLLHSDEARCFIGNFKNGEGENYWSLRLYVCEHSVVNLCLCVRLCLSLSRHQSSFSNPEWEVKNRMGPVNAQEMNGENLFFIETKINIWIPYWIWGFHSGDREENYRLGCDSMWSDRNFLTFGGTYTLHLQVLRVSQLSNPTGLLRIVLVKNTYHHSMERELHLY